MDAKTLNYFTNIKEILTTFDSSELALLRSFTEISQKQSRKSNSLIIVDALANNPELTAPQVKTLLGKRTTNQAFYKNLTRLKEKILESLILDVNLNDQNELSNVFVQRVITRKRIIQAYRLFARGLEAEGRKLLEQVITRGKHMELYDELYEVIHWVRNENGLRYGNKKYDLYTKELEHFKLCRDAVYEARNLYYDYYMFSDHNTDTNEKYNRVTKIVKRLLDLSESTQSKRVKYYYFLLLSESHTLKRKAHLVDELEHDLFQLISRSPVLKTDTKIGIAHSDVADMMLSCGKFDQAIVHSQKAMKRFEENTYNYFVAEEILFRALFLNGNLVRAKNALSLTKCDSLKEEFPLVSSKYAFYRACLFFKQGEHKKSLDACCDLKLLEKDKYGWNITIRVLLTMNSIAQGNLDIADAQVTSFRKYMDRIKKKGAILPRYTYIEKVLIQLRNASFDFRIANRTCKEYIHTLASDQPGYRWDEKSPELIAFHEWFQECLPKRK